MTWTYNGDPAASDMERLRFEIQDTVSTDPLLSDEELQFLLVNNTFYRAAAKACNSIALQFAKIADKKIGPISISASDRAEKYMKLADIFRRRYVLGVPYSGNMSDADEISDVADTNLKQPKFWKDIMANK